MGPEEEYGRPCLEFYEASDRISNRGFTLIAMVYERFMFFRLVQHNPKYS